MAEREDKDDICIDFLSDTEEGIIVIGDSGWDFCAVDHLKGCLGASPDVSGITGTVIIVQTMRMQRTSLIPLLTPTKTSPTLHKLPSRALLVNIDSGAN